MPYKKVQQLASEIWNEEKEKKKLAKGKVKEEEITPGIEADLIPPVSSKLDAKLRYEASTINEVGSLLVMEGLHY